jgi:DNA-binding NarL/FixJ family response regulator
MKRARVLLADDHRMVAEGLRRLLEPEFELVGIVEDGSALLEATRRLKPDLVVADISMPRLNGIEALKELRRNGCDVPLIFLTMHRDPVYARRALEAGAAGYVLKHAAPDELVLGVRAALQGQTFITPALAAEVLRAVKGGPSGATADPVAALTARQREIVLLLAESCSAKHIASQLGISTRTVEFHKYRAMESLGVHSGAELTHFAIKHGLVAL